MQIVRAFRTHISRYEANAKIGWQLILCGAAAAEFRNKLRKHVVVMQPCGFNAHALGVLAARDISLFIASPEALADRFTMLRNIFRPWGDDLAPNVIRTEITQSCLPAVANDATVDCFANENGLPISFLHKSMLAGHTGVLQCSDGGLKRHMRTLVAAGLFDTDAQARHACMRETRFLPMYSLEWYLERKAAMLEAGGTLDDVRAACCQFASLRACLPRVLLSQRCRCGTVRFCVRVCIVCPACACAV